MDPGMRRGADEYVGRLGRLDEAARGIGLGLGLFLLLLLQLALPFLELLELRFAQSLELALLLLALRAVLSKFGFEALNCDEQVVERRFRQVRDRLRRLLHDVLLVWADLLARDGHRRRGRGVPPGPFVAVITAPRTPSLPAALILLLLLHLLRAPLAAPGAPSPSPAVPAIGAVPGDRTAFTVLLLRLRRGRARGCVRVLFRGEWGRGGCAGRRVGLLGDAVAPALGAGLVPGVGVVVAVPPGRDSGAEGEPEEAGGGAAAAVHVRPVVPVRVHLGRCAGCNGGGVLVGVR
ncbi:hypothetical protein C8Q77DRAFT_1143013 [Trametes polyzona]|nr:hypothetical protein C8Q77DRAFT_1143013 [Trametes polyzona]